MPKCEKCKELAILIDEVCGKKLALETENAKLKDFIRYVIRTECWGIEIDGGGAQDKAIELGLLELHTIGPEEPDEYTYCGLDIGDTVYRFTDILKE